MAFVKEILKFSSNMHNNLQIVLICVLLFLKKEVSFYSDL